MSRTPRAAAFAALADHRVPPERALEMFARAYRRASDVTRAWDLSVCGHLRLAGEERAALLRWADDGGMAPAEEETPG